LANNLDKFKKNVVGSNSKINDYTPTITSSGDFKRVTDFTSILNSWNNILLTPIGTYDHDPLYGSNLHKYVFEPVDNETVEGIKHEIKRSIGAYNNQAEISSINVNFLAGGKGFSIDINVDFGNQNGQLTIDVTEPASFKVM